MWESYVSRTRSGLLRGCPRPSLGTRIVSSTAAAAHPQVAVPAQYGPPCIKALALYMFHLPAPAVRAVRGGIRRLPGRRCGHLDSDRVEQGRRAGGRPAHRGGAAAADRVRRGRLRRDRHPAGRRPRLIGPHRLHPHADALPSPRQARSTGVRGYGLSCRTAGSRTRPTPTRSPTTPRSRPSGWPKCSRRSPAVGARCSAPSASSPCAATPVRRRETTQGPARRGYPALRRPRSLDTRSGLITNSVTASEPHKISDRDRWRASCPQGAPKIVRHACGEALPRRASEEVIGSFHLADQHRTGGLGAPAVDVAGPDLRILNAAEHSDGHLPQPPDR